MATPDAREGFFRTSSSDLFVPMGKNLFSPAKKFIRQIAIPGGIQSCYPTSILNGWINQETLTPQEASNIQEKMVANDREWFSDQFEREGMVLRVFNRSPFDLREFISQEVGKNLQLEVYENAKLHNLAMHLRNMIAYGYSVAGGDSIHAVTLISYDPVKDKFRKIDPESPEQTVITLASKTAERFSKGDHIVVLK